MGLKPGDLRPAAKRQADWKQGALRQTLKRTLKPAGLTSRLKKPAALKRAGLKRVVPS